MTYALSDKLDHEKQNVWNIQELPLIEIIISFADNSSGYVIIEKGTHGERIVRETFRKWGPLRDEASPPGRPPRSMTEAVPVS